MKNNFYSRLLPALSGLCFSCMILAQTLTATNSIPAVGQAETRSYHSLFGSVVLATSGTGNTWDMSAAAPFGITSDVTYRAPGDSPYAASYPTTTLCMHRMDGSDEEWRHYRVDASLAELLGANTDVFDGGRTFCTFPFSMGSSFTDTYSINGGPPNTEANEYVAAGTITAPWGTIPNVVMFAVNGGLSYYFYSASNVLDAIGSYSPGFGADLWHVETGTAVAEVALDRIGIGPVPANDVVTLSLPFSGQVRLRLFDGTGREVFAGIVSSTRVSLDVRFLPAGGYLVHATDNAGRTATGKLVKE